MKKTCLALTILFAVSALIYAGPEAISGKEMKQVAPAPPACFDWTGFYAGGFGGYKFSSVDNNLSLGGEWHFVPDSRDLFESEGSRDLDNSGGELGGLLGYNYQWRCWVFGLEADGGYLWARDSHDSGTLSIPADDIGLVHIRSSFQTHYLFTVAPRFGYAFGKWLPYVTGGLAVGDLELGQQINFIGDGSGSGEGGRKTTTNVGWMVGGGLQYALNDHWSLRAQYQFIDLGNVDFDSNFSFINSPAHSSADLREQNASFAVMYKF
jgi:outer membrane immunogenic protein